MSTDLFKTKRFAARHTADCPISLSPDWLFHDAATVSQSKLKLTLLVAPGIQRKRFLSVSCCIIFQSLPDKIFAAFHHLCISRSDKFSAVSQWCHVSLWLICHICIIQIWWFPQTHKDFFFFWFVYPSVAVIAGFKPNLAGESVNSKDTRC